MIARHNLPVTPYSPELPTRGQHHRIRCANKPCPLRIEARLQGDVSVTNNQSHAPYLIDVPVDVPI